jgi:hypothetical protein
MDLFILLLELIEFDMGCCYDDIWVAILFLKKFFCFYKIIIIFKPSIYSKSDVFTLTSLGNPILGLRPTTVLHSKIVCSLQATIPSVFLMYFKNIYIYILKNINIFL